MSIIIQSKDCKGCGLCVKKCPASAMRLNNGTAQINEDLCTGCGACVESCPFHAIKSDAKAVETDICLDDYTNVWVFVETKENGEIARPSLEILCAARELADQRGVEVVAIVPCAQKGNQENTLADHGANHVIFLENPLLAPYTTDAFCKVMCDYILKGKPEIVLIAATHVGRDLAPRIAARLNTGLTADCTELKIDPETGLLLQTRPAFGGNIMATIINPTHRPQMATVRAGVMEIVTCDHRESCRVSTEAVALEENDLRVRVEKTLQAVRSSVDLSKAEIICTAGRGMGGPDGVALVEDLAKALGGEVGSTRAVVEAGWLSQDHQVGQTGKTVRPKLYVACGVSGALQHLAGMSKSKYIVAINTDPNAPIMKVANIALCGDAQRVVPLMTQTLLEEKNR